MVNDVQELEAQLAEKQAVRDDEYEDVGDLAVDELNKASDLLKQCRTMLEFISDPDFCKSITKRERKAIAKLLEKIYTTTDEIDAAVADLEDDGE
jgi:hypothetical protein